MADIYLGLSESGLDPLPPIRWVDGGAPEFGITYSKQVEKASMLNGAQRFNFKSLHPRRWSLAWEMLTAAEMTRLLELNNYNRALSFQNNWEDAEWHDVVITSFEYAPFIKAGPTGCRYSASMTLEEVV